MITNELNKARVADLHIAMTGYVERGDIPGIVTLIGRGDEIHVNAIGMQTVDGKEPMRRDNDLPDRVNHQADRAAATMLLVNDGRFRLDDSVEPWLPELANRKVLRRIDSPLDGTDAARRSITVRDLLTSIFGFGSVMARPGIYFVQQLIKGRASRGATDHPIHS